MIGLMDCNNFFVSCERLFRPDLKKKPVAVLSSNDGCIVARSQEVKDLGIPMGIPHFEVKDACIEHGITLFSSNFTLYRDISARVMHALREEFDEVSVYSIDEAFVNIPSAFDQGAIMEIRARIMQKTGIPVSFGVGPTKVIAKIANGEAKKGDGAVWHTKESVQQQYSAMLCGSVWGIGRQTSARLSELNIRNVADFLAKGKHFARQEFGVVGERLFLELSGVRTDSVHGKEDVQGSVMSTRSFGKAVRSKGALMSALSYHIVQIGEKLRQDGLVAGKLRIIAAGSRFDSYAFRKGSAKRSLEIPTNDTTALLTIARELLGELYDPEVPYKKAGVIVSGLMPEACAPQSLFEESEKEGERTHINTVVDALNDRFGRGTVRPGSILETQSWASRSDSKSPSYTTVWSEIVTVKAI